MIALCIELKRGQLQSELDAVQGREMKLVAARQSLEGELNCSRTELESCREELEHNQVELSKAKMYSHTLDKRNKVLNAKCCGLTIRCGVLIGAWSS